jgi:asparagine synthase (glutamine-hydrolysing)
MSRIAGFHSENPERSAGEATLLFRALGELAGRPVTTLSAGRCVIGIVDAATPNVAELGRWYSVFDGQIYNRGEIDAATGVANPNDAARFALLVQKRGLPEALNAINGDFAAAIYDKSSDRFYLARDRFGIKPLYYVVGNGRLAFASRPAALLELSGVSRDVNTRFVATFAGGHYRHIDNRPRESPFRDIHQLPAAHYLEWHAGLSTVRRYWDLKDVEEFSGGPAELSERYRALLLDSVARRMVVADRPAFALSGGLDSSSVLSCAVEWAGTPQAAYSSVYVDPTFDETNEIRTMLGAKVSKWNPVKIGSPDVVGLTRRMVRAHDEPVATATWLSHFLLCEEAARAGVGTIFGGLGGDELNAGEYEYFFFLFADLMRAGDTASLNGEIAEWGKHHDHPIYRKTKKVVEETLSRVVDMQRAGVCRPDTKRMSRYFKAIDPGYFHMESDPHEMEHPFASYLKNRTYQDLFRETAPCCLRAEDRQAEAHGLQHIDPFFDYRLAEFMFRVPGSMKIRDGITKRLLRDAMQGILPEETRTRIKKTGWNAPAHRWFTEGPAAEEVGDLIASQGFRERGIYVVDEVRRLYDEHRRIVLSGKAMENHMMFFWQLLNLEIWFQEVAKQPDGVRA